MVQRTTEERQQDSRRGKGWEQISGDTSIEGNSPDPESEETEIEEGLVKGFDFQGSVQSCHNETEDTGEDLDSFKNPSLDKQSVHEARRDFFLIGSAIFAAALIGVMVVTYWITFFMEDADTLATNVVMLLLPLVTFIFGVVARDYVQK